MRRCAVPRNDILRGLAFIILGMGLLYAGGCEKRSAAKPTKGARGEGGAAVPVTVATVEQRTTPVAVSSFGTVEAYADVEVRAQVTGILEQVHFTEGQMVKKGDRLLSIDPRQPQANLKMAQANLEKDQAQLKNAEREAARQTELLQKGFASQDVYDQAHDQRGDAAGRGQRGSSGHRKRRPPARLLLDLLAGRRLCGTSARFTGEISSKPTMLPS